MFRRRSMKHRIITRIICNTELLVLWGLGLRTALAVYYSRKRQQTRMEDTLPGAKQNSQRDKILVRGLNWRDTQLKPHRVLDETREIGGAKLSHAGGRLRDRGASR